MLDYQDAALLPPMHLNAAQIQKYLISGLSIIFFLKFPEIQKNSLVVLDNAIFHKSEKTNELVEKLSDRLIPTI